MNKEENFKTFIGEMEKYLDLEKLRIIPVQDDKLLNVEEIKIGLISYFCTWSGYSYAFGKKILSEISTQMTQNEVPLYLVDTDYTSLELRKKLFDSSSWGYFESCWIENGEIKMNYKYRHELAPFIEFIKKRLTQIEELLRNKYANSYILDSLKENFGIERKDFTSDDRAIVLSKSKYRNEFLYNLMKYEKKGSYYLYEDDEIIIYDATAPSFLSSCFIIIKNKNKGCT